MTRTAHTRSAAKLAQAQILRELETTWRNWRAFVAEKKDELARRQADEAGIDDLTTPLAGAPAARKARLTAAARQELAMITEQRRQAAQRDAEAAARTAGATPPDVEQVMERLLARIDDELNGRLLSNGNALVWFDGQLVEFDYRAVSSGTIDDDYLAAGAASPAAERRRRMIIVGIAAVFLLGAAFLAFGAFGGGEVATARGPTLGSVAAQPAPLWDIQTLSVGGVSGPISGAALGYPTLVCLTDAQREAARPGATVVLSGTASVRAYTLHDRATAQPRDLVVADCTQTPPVLLASAGLSATTLTQALPERLIARITTTGADTDPATIPANQMRVDVTVAQARAPQGTLILPDGTRWSPAASAESPQGTVLTYLVPAATTAQAAGWEMTVEGGQPGRVALSIPAPVSRAALLRGQLSVSARGAEVSTRNGSPILTLSLDVTLDAAAAPITLLASDLVLTRGGGNRAPEWQPPTLAPGKRASVRIVIPLQDAGSSIEAALGGWRARLRY